MTHLLAISHSLWTFHNCVVHDWTMEGTAHAAELQVTEDLYAQFKLALQDIPFSEWHYIKGHSVDSLLHAPLMDHQQWLAHIALAHQIGHQQCQARIRGMQAALHTFLHPTLSTPWEFELHLGSGLFLCSGETDEILLTTLVSGLWHNVIFP